MVGGTNPRARRGATATRSRRSRVVTPSIRATVIATTIAVIVVTCLGAILSELDAHASSSTEYLAAILTVLASALFLGAGALKIARGRITEESTSILMGVALVVLGSFALPLTSIAQALARTSATSMLPSLTAFATTMVALSLVIRALHGNVLDTPPPLVRLLATSLGGALLSFLWLVAAHYWTPDLLTTDALPTPAFHGSLLCMAWFTIGFAAARRADEQPWAGSLAPLFGCMAVAELMRALSVVSPGAWHLAGGALVAVISAITAHRALLDLDDAIKSGREDLAAVDQALSSSREDAGNQRAWREEFTHDARNALAGLRAALTTLDQYGGALDEGTIERLRSAALGEVGHLEHLITRSDRDKNIDFDLARVIGTVVNSRRAAGLDVTETGPAIRAHGRPGDVATALQNLIVNAQQHAQGPVRVTTRARGDWIDVTVADSGPGLAPGQSARLFQRGARGPDSGGLGVGLHISRVLMRRQGGDLTAGSVEGFCEFTLTLLRAGGDRPLPSTTSHAVLAGRLSDRVDRLEGPA